MQRPNSSIIKYPGFINLWLNQILVQLAYNSLNFALLIWVFRLTDSSLAVAGLMLAIYLPAVVFGLFAGVLIDIFDRRRIINVIDLCMAVCLFSLIFLKGSYPAILAITFLVNTLGIFYLASEASAIPLIVEKKQLLGANSLFATTVHMTFLLGFGMSGPLMSLFGIDLVFGVGAVALSLAFGLSLLMPEIKSKLTDQARGLKQALQTVNLHIFGSIAQGEIKKTLRIIKGKPSVLGSIALISGQQATVGVMGALIPAFFEKIIHVNASDASIVLIIPLGLGTLLGALLIGRFGAKVPRWKLIGTGVTTAGLLLTFIGVTPLFNPIGRHLPRRIHIRPFFLRPSHSLMLGIGAFALGLSLVSVLIPTQTIVQEETPEEIRGKVFSVLSAAMSGAAILPVILSGVIADIIGASNVFGLIGVMIFLAGASILSPEKSLFTNFLPRRVKKELGV